MIQDVSSDHFLTDNGSHAVVPRSAAQGSVLPNAMIQKAGIAFAAHSVAGSSPALLMTFGTEPDPDIQQIHETAHREAGHQPISARTVCLCSCYD
ncbi:MAG: hypothetical protein M0T84_17660 [Betaproteobacteria bacterium]|nr:hypothetical protein [Betaproteobacteria bacterium]